MIHNKLDKLFGQAGSVLGWGIMLVGIFTSIIPLAILLFLIGSFMAFSYSGIYVDQDDDKYKFYRIKKEPRMEVLFILLLYIF